MNDPIIQQTATEPTVTISELRDLRDACLRMCETHKKNADDNPCYSGSYHSVALGYEGAATLVDLLIRRVEFEHEHGMRGE